MKRGDVDRVFMEHGGGLTFVIDSTPCRLGVQNAAGIRGTARHDAFCRSNPLIAACPGVKKGSQKHARHAVRKSEQSQDRDAGSAGAGVWLAVASPPASVAVGRLDRYGNRGGFFGHPLGLAYLQSCGFFI